MRAGWRLLAWCGAALFGVTTAPSALGAPIKVACIGEHTTHSHAFPADNREAQPEGMQEYPAQLQTLLGAGYEVRNFGDCCATVMQGYTVAETHPYVNGSNANDGPGFDESIAFEPDIVIIGSWGRHDWGLSKAPGQVFTLQAFEDGFDDLIGRYQALPSKPKIFISLPVPILFGKGDVADNGVKTQDVVPVVLAVATKYELPVIDLYQPFLGHMELFKQPGDPRNEGEGEHVTDAGLTIIANEVFKVMQQELASGGSGGSGGSGDSSGSGGAAGAEGGSAFGGAAGTRASGGAATAGQAGMGMGGQAGTMTTAPAAGTNGVSPPSSMEDSGCGCAAAGRGGTPSAAWLAAVALGLALQRRRIGVGCAPKSWRTTFRTRSSL